MTITASVCRLCHKMRKISKFSMNGVLPGAELTMCDDCQSKVDKATKKVTEAIQPIGGKE